MSTVYGYILRQSMLYVSRVEYGNYTMNHVLGCSHGCKYPCYAFLLKRRFGKISSYEDWTKPYLVSNTLELLDREIPRLKSKIKSVQLCFTTDPFMYGYHEIEEMSLAAIKKLNSHGIRCNVLSKGVLPFKLTEYSKDNEYGITLVSLDEKYLEKNEPGAAPFQKRLEAIKKLHHAGCKTWISIEPYPTPNIIRQDISKILEEVSFADKIIFGRTNYSKEISEYNDRSSFYNNQAKHVINFCTKRNIKFHIKSGTISKPNNPNA